PKVDGYMYPAGTVLPQTLKNKAESMINSMRNVDSECKGLIVSLYNSVDSNEDEKSWEGLFS
ncbi:hypothetical protein P4619_20305, partial [Halalkalibacterium halodurans]|nr:hypothetical protein [Halalkalibacterium halodurans]